MMLELTAQLLFLLFTLALRLALGKLWFSWENTMRVRRNNQAFRGMIEKREREREEQWKERH
jgi:hypothetical protein